MKRARRRGCPRFAFLAGGLALILAGKPAKPIPMHPDVTAVILTA